MQHSKKVTIASLLVTMGVVYGDIGTSPLYVMKAILAGNGGLGSINEEFIIGSISLVIWTVTLMTTVKYVLIALRADNHGEGGIFSLYTLVRKVSPYLIFPALIGGATLLADGILTPAVTITTAVEGLRGLPFFYDRFGNNQEIIVIITLTIILLLFTIQRFGTEKVGKTFGPIMFCWFTFLGAMGLYNLSGEWHILKALNPYYAFELLVSPANKAGILILGSVFLATTGAEALYADMGHVGRNNIYASWPYIKLCLLLNYFGQGAWLMEAMNDATYLEIEDLNPFFSMIPNELSLISVAFATLAAIIASQSLISGSFTLVSEAIKLKLFPKLKIIYPSNQKGQMYIPVINWLLCLLCMLIVFSFKTSQHLESAYGLSITITMLMTAILLWVYLLKQNIPAIIAHSFLLFFSVLQSVFFYSNIAKFMHGGYVAILIAFVLFIIMLTWHLSNKIKEKVAKKVPLANYVEQLEKLSNSEDIPLYQTNVVYLTDDLSEQLVDLKILYSILDKKPKRAQVYWFVNLYVTDEPYTKEYYVETFNSKHVVSIQLRLGFRMSQKVNVYMRQIVQEMMAQGLIDTQEQEFSIEPGRSVGDFCFVLINDGLYKGTTGLSNIEKLTYQLKLAIKAVTTSTENWFGLQYSDVVKESVPLVIDTREYPEKYHLTMKRTHKFSSEEL
ncbi:KUP/HAK/KT family potassium transporter [Vagococcus xieshaowenii]|uniref:Probable potassium transport system protein Kup n=1 Tax=Vagococcus xieshaowenii TaxID=2562451 RepID=A0A4Z0D9F4_9ENTE|nr:KUP/HAK/KT family potassium transporter [Vagococcus xieshaowenii]QCA29408.1 potassium transporter Kup [Vagococcus xieshaowenii]TFZ41529.1 potassium transporter Kup [Vagococcus xieshaowenii]